MNSKIVTSKIEQAMADMGIPQHLVGMKRVPSKVVASVMVGGRLVEIEAPSGITQSELEFRIGQLRGQWQLHQGGQRDLVVEAAE